MKILNIKNKIIRDLENNASFVIEEIEILGETKLSVVISFKNTLMGSIEYVENKSLDLMIFVVSSNSLAYSKTIEYNQDFDQSLNEEFINYFDNFI